MFAFNLDTGAQWLSGRVLDSRPRGSGWGRGFEPHGCHCVVSLSKNINPSLVLVQPMKARPFITERLLMGRKESIKKQPHKQTIWTHSESNLFTVVLTKSDSDELFCLQLLSEK